MKRVPRENSGLDGSTVSESLIGVDELVRLLAIEEDGDTLNDTGNTGRATNEDDLVNLGLVDLRIPENLLNGIERAAEEILAQLLETGAGERSIEIDALEEGVDFDRGLGGR